MCFQGLSQFRAWVNKIYLLWACFRGETVRQFPNSFPSKMCQILWLFWWLGSQSVAAAEFLMVVGSFSGIHTSFPSGTAFSPIGIEDEHWNACPKHWTYCLSTMACHTSTFAIISNLQQCLNASLADFWNHCFSIAVLYDGVVARRLLGSKGSSRFATFATHPFRSAMGNCILSAMLEWSQHAYTAYIWRDRWTVVKCCANATGSKKMVVWVICW